MVKKIVSVVLVSVFLSLSLSGCGIVKSFFTYWDGMTKSEVREYVQTALKEKYGEEFVVKHLAKTGANYYTPSALLVKCSPKSDESIVFDIEVEIFGKDENRKRYLSDNYIQNVVRKQLKQTIDNILAENYENFVSQVFVTPLKYWYDSGIRSANNATIKNFSESFTNNDDNYTLVYIAVNSSEKDFDKVKNELQKMSKSFYSLNVSIDFYYTDEQTIEQCREKNSKSYRELGIPDILRQGNFEMYHFVFFNDERDLVYIPKDD